MKKHIAFVSIIVFALLLRVRANAVEPQKADLWPQIDPYNTGYLKVSPIHELFYQEGGNPKGKPVMFLHGGPGSGCFPGYFRYFNPEKFHVVLHDQRGAGKSKPFAEIKENTTQLLVEDVEKLRTHLNLGKVILFGGSWGSTLALAYAEKYPQNVAGIILRGVFTGRKSEIDHFYHGGAAHFFPKEFDDLKRVLDHPEKKNYPAQLLAKLLSPAPAIRSKYAKAWAFYESKMSGLETNDKEITRMYESWNPYAFSLIENYYMANNCFLKEGQLMANTGKLAGIPVYIVNGRYDTVCPPITAYELHKRLKNSKLFIAEQSGHSSSDAPLRYYLLEAVKAFE